jgi:hypothetical protein
LGDISSYIEDFPTCSSGVAPNSFWNAVDDYGSQIAIASVMTVIDDYGNAIEGLRRLAGSPLTESRTRR